MRMLLKMGTKQGKIALQKWLIAFSIFILVLLLHPLLINTVLTQASAAIDEFQTPTVVYSNVYLSGISSKTDLYYFNNNLVISLENVNGSRLDPHSNTSFTGTLYYGDTGIPPGAGNSALRLDGKTYVNCGNDLSLLWQDAGSVAFWAKIDLLGTWQTLVDKRGYGIGTSNEGYGVSVSSNNAMGFAVVTDVGSYTSHRYTLDGKWHYFMGTWGNNELRLYVDGKQFGATVTTEGTITIGENYPLYIGARQPGYGFTSGVIDEVRVFNRALSPSEVWEHYQGVYSNETGLVLYLSFDGDVKDRSGKEHQCVIQGTNYAWTDGYANVNIIVELNGTIKKVTSLVNSTSGWFSVPLTSEDAVGRYCYRVYPMTSGSKGASQTLCIIVDRLKIVEGGITATSAVIGEAQTVWFKATYEFDGSEFTGEHGVLFLNGTAMKWSDTKGRWESTFNPVVPGDVTLKVTGVIDRRYGLTNMYNEVGFISISVGARVNPISWVNVLLLGIVAIFSLLGIFGFKIEKVIARQES